MAVPIDEVPSQAQDVKPHPDDDTLEQQSRDPLPPTEENAQNSATIDEIPLPPTPGESPLCRLCKAVFEQWDQFVLQDAEIGFPHWGSTSDLHASAEWGCSLCTQFIYACRMDDDSSIRRAAEATTRRVRYGDAESEYPRDSTTVRGSNSRPSSGNRQQDTATGALLFYRSPMGIRFLKFKPSHGTDQRSIFLAMLKNDDSSDIDFSELSSNSRRPSTRDSLEQCKEWLNRCSGSHEVCKTSPLFVPTRLIRVRGGFPHLVSLEELKDGQRYATLSHCWGKSTFLTLSKSNIDDFRKQIPPEALSKTFLDAIHVCQTLGIEYIWIDSLCIVQDDGDDWRKESALMSKVYGCSHINIVASGASNGHIGLFFDRSPFWRCRVGISVSGAREIYNCFPIDLYEGSIRWMPLSGRGWAVQERLLPSRSILFTETQVFWECYQESVCETFPQTYPAVLAQDESADVAPVAKQPIKEVNWSDVVAWYTRGRLTKARDKLIAISGVARELQLSTKDQYIAGLWRKNLEVYLCWEASPVEDYEIAESSLNRAPTWSWASIDLPVQRWHRPSTDHPAELYIRALDVLTKPDEDPFDAISTAQISLGCSSLLIKTIDQDYPRLGVSTEITIGRGLLTFLVSFSHTGDTNLRTLYFLPVFTISSEGWTFLNGLVLQASSSQPRCFQRIGSFLYSYTDLDWDSVREKIFSYSDSQAGDEVYTRIDKDENGNTRKIITLV